MSSSISSSSSCSSLLSDYRAGPRHNFTRIGLDNYHDTVHGHEFGGQSRVVMVRKTDQRIFASAKNGEEPKYETVTKETYETFRGNRTERKVTSVEKKSVYDKLPSDLRESLSPTSKTASRLGSPAKNGSPKGKMGGVFSGQQDKKSQQSWAIECLAAHNEYRAKHGVPPLKLSKQICLISQKWVDTLVTRGKLTHSEHREYGENIFSVWNSDPQYVPTGREPVDSWYNEIKDHTFGVEPTSLISGHFTQVIWKDSKELGVAYGKAKDGKYIVVANYSPPGNLIGSFSINVPPVGGEKSLPGVLNMLKVKK